MTDWMDDLVDLSRGSFRDYRGPLAEEAKPTGKGQIAIMQRLRRDSAGTKHQFTELVTGFKGMHFGGLMKAAEALAKKGLVSFNGKTIQLSEDSPLEAPTTGFSRHDKLMAPGTRELVLKSRMTEIEAFAEDRGYDPAMVFAVAEVSMRMGRVPPLHQYGFSGEDAKAVRHFIAGDILNLAVEDEQPRQALGCAYGSAGALPIELEEGTIGTRKNAPRQLGLHRNSDGSGWTALTHSASKEFKSEGGAVRWLKKRGYDESGRRIKQEDDWSEAEALCEASALLAPKAAHVLDESLSGELPEDRVHRNAAGGGMEEVGLLAEDEDEELDEAKRVPSKILKLTRQLTKETGVPGKVTSENYQEMIAASIKKLEDRANKLSGEKGERLRTRIVAVKRVAKTMGLTKVAAEDAAEVIGDLLNEVSPPGWSGTTKAMKTKHPEIDNPFALAWSMHKKGAKPGIKPEKGKPKYRSPETQAEAVQKMRKCPTCRAKIPVLPSGKLMTHSAPHTQGKYSCPGEGKGKITRVTRESEGAATVDLSAAVSAFRELED